jgi:hypothetical protein
MSNKIVREASGKVIYPSSDWLTSFLYELMRDAIPAGQVETIVRSIEEKARKSGLEDILYTNGWLAKYANHLAERIRKVTKFKSE